MFYVECFYVVLKMTLFFNSCFLTDLINCRKFEKKIEEIKRVFINFVEWIVGGGEGEDLMVDGGKTREGMVLG